MSPFLLPLLDLGGRLIEKFVPDKSKQAQAEMELLKMAQEGELKTVLAQLEINAKEAQHPSIWVAGWRPFVGWTCGAGLAYQTIFHNLVVWLSGIYNFPPPPAPNTEVLLYVLGGLLGIGALRTYEKKHGVTK